MIGGLENIRGEVSYILQFLLLFPDIFLWVMFGKDIGIGSWSELVKVF